MGMFDNLLCKRKLPLSKELKKAFPNTDWSEVDFQTKALDNTMSLYLIKGNSLYAEVVEGEYVRTITEEEEKKVRKERKFVWPYKFEEHSRELVKQNFHGTINFYHYMDDEEGNSWSIDFEATFNKGKLLGIKLVKGEISASAEENAKMEKAWQDRQDAYENHPWTKTKKILNKITFGYWSTFWNNVSKILYASQQKLQKLQMWVIRNLA
jgi:hypothetical protein